MLYGLLYYTFIGIELLAGFLFAVYSVSMLFSYLKGAPYISTENKEIDDILKKAGLKTGQKFLELGCGDGRVVRSAVKNYSVKGKGIDINPTLIFLAKIRAKLQNVKNIEFSTENVYTTDMNTADVIYLFLLPQVIAKLKNQLISETKTNVLIISHGFKIDYLKNNLVKTLENKPFNTYFYKRPIDKSPGHSV